MRQVDYTLLLKTFLHLHFVKGFHQKKLEAIGEEPVTPPYNILKYTLWITGDIQGFSGKLPLILNESYAKNWCNPILQAPFKHKLWHTFPLAGKWRRRMLPSSVWLLQGREDIRSFSFYSPSPRKSQSSWCSNERWQGSSICYSSPAPKGNLIPAYQNSTLAIRAFTIHGRKTIPNALG